MWKTPTTIVHTLPAHCMKPWCLNQQQLDQQSYRSRLWTKTKGKTQSLSTLLKQVRTEAENVASWFLPYTEQCCDSGPSWPTSQLHWSAFSSRAGQRRHLLFYFDTAIPKTCQNRISFTFTRWLQSLLPLSHWFKTITEVIETYSQCLFSGCWLQSSTQWILHKQMPHQLVCPGIFASIWSEEHGD